MSKEIEQDGFITREADLKGSKRPEPKGMVLIKSMEKPRSCASCRLKDLYYGECNVKHKKIKVHIESGSMPAWCPLTEVIAYGPEGTLYKEK